MFGRKTSKKTSNNLSTPCNKFICDLCGAAYHRKFSLKRHIFKFHFPHPNSSNRSRNIVCPFCKIEFTLFKVLDNHLATNHNLIISEEQHNFQTSEEFLSWKEHEEKASQSQYFSYAVSRNKNGESVRVFLCTRSGKYKARASEAERRRAGPSKGSRKIGATCPSRMQATYTKNGVQVLYYPNHSPHEKEFCHISLGSTDREFIANKLKAGVALDSILQEFKTHASETSLEKKNFITKKHLYNIMKKYNLSITNQRNQQNETHVSLLCKEFEKMTENPFLLFKKQGEEHDELKTSDMVIVLMTEAQKQMLQKSSFAVCIDSTYGSNKYEYQLTTLATVDEQGVAFPCSYCISNNINETILKVYLDTIMYKLRTQIHPTWFLSDHTPLFYEVWKNVVSEVPNRFTCKWHMENKFKNDLSLITDKKIRSTIYSCLRSLLKAPHKNKYSTSFKLLSDTLKQKNLNVFYKYFMTSYANTPETWAISHITDETFLAANTMLESLHQLILDAYLKSRKNQRIDELIRELLKIVRDMSLTRVTKLDDCLVHYYTERLTNLHERALEVNESSLVGEREWYVQSTQTKDLFHVIRAQRDSKCFCNLKCSICDVCVHEFCCTCHNYEILGDLCKHIHAVNIFYGEGSTNIQSCNDANNLLIRDEFIEIEVASSDLIPENKNEIMCAKIEELFSLLETKNDWSDVPEDNVIKITDHIDMVIKLLNDDTVVTPDCS